MSGFIEGVDRDQVTLFPERLEDWIGEDHLFRVVDLFVEQLDLVDLGFARAAHARTGRPSRSDSCGRTAERSVLIHAGPGERGRGRQSHEEKILRLAVAIMKIKRNSRHILLAMPGREPEKAEQYMWSRQTAAGPLGMLQSAIILSLLATRSVTTSLSCVLKDCSPTSTWSAQSTSNHVSPSTVDMKRSSSPPPNKIS